MKGNELLIAAGIVETRKAIESRVVLTATVLLVVGIGTLAGTFTVAARAGNEQILAQLGHLADADGWDQLIGVAAQISAAGGLLGFGVVLSWLIGREFSDGTVGGLFALPVRRSVVAVAKLTVFTVWAMMTAAFLVVVVLILGVVIRVGSLDAVVASALARLFCLTALSGLLAFPAAWAATVGRGLLPGIATAIGLVVLTQVAVVSGTGAWFPVAAPALWVASPESVSALQLALVAVVPMIFGAFTLVSWNRLELDR